MSAITTLRGTLATALASASVWSVFSFPPATPIANSCVISPDDPYIVPSNDGYITVAPLVNFKITLIKPLFDNQGNLNGMEDYILEHTHQERKIKYIHNEITYTHKEKNTFTKDKKNTHIKGEKTHTHRKKK